MEGANSVGVQLREVKECSFSGVTSSGRDWRKVPESDAGSVCYPLPEPTKALPLAVHKIRRRQIVGRLPSGGDTALQLKSV